MREFQPPSPSPRKMKTMRNGSNGTPLAGGRESKMSSNKGIPRFMSPTFCRINHLEGNDVNEGLVKDISQTLRVGYTQSANTWIPNCSGKKELIPEVIDEPAIREIKVKRPKLQQKFFNRLFKDAKKAEQKRFELVK